MLLLSWINGISNELFVGLCVGGLVLIGLLITVIVMAAKRKNKGDFVDKIKIKDGVRYSKDSNITTPGGNINITHNVGDVVLSRGKKHTAKKGSPLLPGKYTVLSADQNADKFNIRIGGFVREFKHNSEIVLNEGDEVTAVSHNVVLR